MCQNAFIERSEQIERCVENGMPEKIVKSVMYTLKKRVKLRENSSKPIEETTTNTKKTSTLSVVDSNLLGSRVELLSNNKMDDTLQELLSTTTTTTKTTITTTNPVIAETSNLKIPKMCGRFRQQANKSQITTHKPQISDGKVSDQIKKPQYIDVLNVGTAYTKIYLQGICRTFDNFKETKTYTLLTKTTQPAHFIAICVLSVVLLTIWPDLIDSSTTATSTATTTTTKKTNADSNILAAIAYLGAFATHFGAQIWMTFISGLSLYFSLPRHTFGQCQQILFPKYFALNSVLSIILLVIFVKSFLHTWSLAITVQFVTLVMNPVIELTIRLYLAPPMLRLMHEKYKIELAVGSGKEVGSIVQGDLSECPHYQRIHKAFRRLHMTIAIGNMMTLMATCIQLYFLASKIQIQIS